MANAAIAALNGARVGAAGSKMRLSWVRANNPHTNARGQTPRGFPGPLTRPANEGVVQNPLYYADEGAYFATRARDAFARTAAQTSGQTLGGRFRPSGEIDDGKSLEGKA